MLRERGGENIDLRQSPAEAGEEEAPVLADQLVLQNSNHLPAEFAQRAIHFAVTRLAAGKLHAPELRVLPRLRDAERAAVPKAAVDEDGEATGAENEVGLTEQLPVAAPAGEAVDAHDRDQPKLGRRAVRTNISCEGSAGE